MTSPKLRSVFRAIMTASCERAFRRIDLLHPTARPNHAARNRSLCNGYNQDRKCTQASKDSYLQPENRRTEKSRFAKITPEIWANIRLPIRPTKLSIQG